jgi:uracil-DNA glycosylase
MKVSNIQPTLICPSYENILKAFHYSSPEEVRVVILGQDPYPDPMEASGLAFSTLNKKLTGSLRNIIKAINYNYPTQTLKSGDLEHWATQGVLLLNRYLTTVSKKPKAHADIWKPFTDFLISYLDSLPQKPIFVLWGDSSSTVEPLIVNCKVLKWRHPSPLANCNVAPEKHFSKCTHFKDINDYILDNNLGEPILWGNQVVEITKEILDDDVVKMLTSLPSSEPDINNNPLIDDTDISVDTNSSNPFAEDINVEDIPIEASQDTSKDTSQTSPPTSSNNSSIFVKDKITIIFTDGAAKSNGKPNAKASYAFVVNHGPYKGYKESGLVPIHDKYKPSNSRGELLGMIRAIEYAIEQDIKDNVVVFCDNKYCVFTYNTWLDKWIRENELSSKANLDLIDRIISIKKTVKDKRMKVKVIQCKGHVELPKDKTSDEYYIAKGNYDADLLATSTLK